jgi:hypothetical protein
MHRDYQQPRCGARLISPNLQHSCGDFSFEQFLEGKPERSRGLFRRSSQREVG